MQIETALGACYTVVFLNKTHTEPKPMVWVCTSVASYEASLKHLQGMKHIEIIQSGLSHVQDGSFRVSERADLSL